MSPAEDENLNIARSLPIWAQRTPDKIAVSAPISKKGDQYIYEELSFQELNSRSLFFAQGLIQDGLKAGDKVLMFVKPSIDFSALTFALFRAGLIPVFIDPGMGRKNLLQAIEHIKPDGLIAEPIVHLMALLMPKAFKSIKYSYTMGSIAPGKLKSIKRRAANWKTISKQDKTPLMYQCKSETTAAVLFTSGGTGIPKAVRYNHGIFNAQVHRLQNLFNLTPQDVDLPGFPLFSLFTITMGMKSAIPAMNPSKPAKADPIALIKNIEDSQASFVAGSPAIWKNLVAYCLENKVTLPSIKYLVMFGAPIPLSLHRDFKKIIINGDTYTPYGATECLPVANISGTEVLEIAAKLTTYDRAAGFSTCVGFPAPETTIKIAPITDEILEDTSTIEWLAPNQVGEVCVLSATVTPEYIGMPKKTAEAKIREVNNTLWHRMGDLGYLDEEGRLWFCGRKTHRLDIHGQCIPCIPQESVYNEFEHIQRCALVGPVIQGEVSPTLIIQPDKSLSKEQRESLSQSVLSHDSKYNRLLKNIIFTPQLPVDVRHNIKIDRLKLKEQVEDGSLQ